MKNVCLVGMGPHAKRIHLNYFKKKKINLALLVELESNKKASRNYLDKNGFKDTKIFAVPDIYKDNEHLPNDLANNLIAICNLFEITHMIISTEPKAHYMYLEFALKNNINVLTDKPITVNKNMTSMKSINKVRKQYYDILKMAAESTAECKVMCQRQYHRGYELIKKILEDTVYKYQIPITNIEIFHSDGNWEMPHDILKENHPYKYGYGKLFHSGYHFIDLLSDFIKINDVLTENKKIVSADVYSKVYTPNDEINSITIDDYKNIFKKQTIPDYYYNNEHPKFDKFGEKDYHGLLTFYNNSGFTITTASLNLLHNGVSRRAWIETRDFYKQNGRIRHERVNIEIGHLMNIQVHSYQSKEISERTSNEENVGGLEHFDIYIFRNPIIGGLPFEEIHLGDLYTEKEKKEFLGYNELSRELFLDNFFKGNTCKGDIKDQALAIEILYACAKGIHDQYYHENPIEKINVRNKYTYRFISKSLKKYCKYTNRNLEKKLINSTIEYKDIYTFHAYLQYIPKLNSYDSYLAIDDTKNIASGLLSKNFKSKFLATMYFKILNLLIKSKNIKLIEYLVENS
mgnify:FL=1